jgi:hypothetical protein
MGIFQGDVIIKAMVDLSLEEMKKNTWLFDDIFNILRAIPYISDKYGQSNIDAAREWFLNNKINVYLRPRNDKDEMPCVAIFPGASTEKDEMKTESDASVDTVTLMPSQIGKPIPYVVKPFVPINYDEVQGEISLDPNTPGIQTISPGMILVDVVKGNGYQILSTSVDAKGNAVLLIEPGQPIEAMQFAVVPQYPYYTARVEHTFCQETYTIGCYAHGDPQNTIWLWSIVLYAILRYRETLLEGNGFAQSSVSSGELLENPNYSGPDGEQSFARLITLTGQVETSWIKAPKRTLENISFTPTSTANGITGGIVILSNLDTPPIIDPTQESWYTLEDDENS